MAADVKPDSRDPSAISRIPRDFVASLEALARRHLGIVLVLVAFLVLGIVYSQSTPILEGPDEMWHYPYVKYIADGRGLPMQLEDGTKSEYHQPPLYYIVGGLATFPLYTDDLEALMVRNPYWGYRARAPEADNKNIFLHTDREAWPYRGATLAIHIVRWLSVLLSATAVLGVYLLGLEAFPESRHLALGAAALAAFTPQFLYLSGTVNNDNLITPLCTWVVWLLARLIRGKGGVLQLLAVGALVGLALITKWTALALLPLLGLVLLYRWLTRFPAPGRWWGPAGPIREGLIMAAPAAVLSGWYFFRNQLLYSDPLGIGRKMDIFPPRSPVPSIVDLIAEIPRKELSYWASFGWENVYADPWVYPLLRAFAYIGLVGVLVFLGHSWRTKALERTTWAHLCLMGAWIAGVGAAFVRWMIYTEAAVGRHLFPAIGCGMLLLLLGWTWFLPRRGARWVTAALSAALFALAAITPFRYIQPTYAPPPRFTAETAPVITDPLDVNYGDKVRLVGYHLGESVAPGGTLQVTLFWQVLTKMTEDYSVFIHVLGQDNSESSGFKIVAQRDSHPGLGSYPTSRWRPGEIIQDTYPVPIPAEASAPARLKIMTGFYLYATMHRVPIMNDAPQAHDAADVGWVSLSSPQAIVIDVSP